MIPQQVALQLDPLVFNESSPKWHSEANDTGLDLAVSFLVLSFRRQVKYLTIKSTGLPGI